MLFPTVALGLVLFSYAAAAQPVGAYQNVSVKNNEVQGVAQFIQHQVNRGSTFIAKVTNILHAQMQVVSPTHTVFDVKVTLTNTTCVMPNIPWASCCLRAQVKTCQAIVDHRLRRYFSRNLLSLRKITCTPSEPPSRCDGCIEPQRSLSNYINITRTALRLYAQANSLSSVPTLRHVVSVSTQVVAGLKYYVEATVDFSGSIKVCSFQVVEQLWLSVPNNLIEGSCSKCTRPW